MREPAALVRVVRAAAAEVAEDRPEVPSEATLETSLRMELTRSVLAVV